MAINAVSIATPTLSAESMKVQPHMSSGEVQQSFATTLKNAIANVNESQLQSDAATEKLINGGDIELHDVMIASQKASITLSATMEVRNKAVEAYQEIMRMSV